MKQKIGYIIKEIRLRQQLKQQYVASKLGISIDAYANIENGRADMNTHRLDNISLILGVKASTIILLAEANDEIRQ